MLTTEELQKICEEYTRVEKGISREYQFHFPEGSVSRPLLRRKCFDVYSYFVKLGTTIEHGEVRVRIYTDGREPEIVMFKEAERI